MKKSMKRVVMLTLNLFLGMTILGNNVMAQQKSAEEVFDSKTVQQLIKEADKKPVRKDKTNKGIGSIIKSSGNYPRRKGVILVTSDYYKGLIPTGHVAIVYSSNKVVESLLKGVTTGKNNWYSSKKSCYGVTTPKTTIYQDAYVADWCYLQIGKKYNYNYFNVDTRKKFYCSQLIYAGYLDKQRIDLNTKKFGRAVHPMELVNTDKTCTIYTK